MTINKDLLHCRGATPRKLQKGQAVFYEGEKAKFYYHLISGQVRMINTDTSGREFIQGLFGPGDSFGEAALITDQTYPATAITDTDSVLLRLPKADFIQLLKEDQEMHFSLTCRLAARLVEKSLLCKEICLSEPATLIGCLLRQYTCDASPRRNGRRLVTITRRQIAGMTGLRLETVIRTIRAMYRRGELLLEKRKLYV